MADIPPIMVELGGSAAGFLRMLTNASNRLTAFQEVFTEVAEACSVAFDGIDVSAQAMADSMRVAATGAGESLTALGEDARSVGAGFSAAGEEMAASMQAAAAEFTAAAVEMRDAVLELGTQVKATAAESAEATEGLGAKFLGLGEIGGMLKAALPLSIAAIGYESVKMAGTFQASITQLNTQAGVAKDKLAGLASGVLDLAGKVGFSPDSLSEALFHVESSFASTGITGQKAMDILKTAAEGAAVGHANLVDVQNALDASIASGIPGVQNYSQAMGALNAIVGAGDMQMQDLANALGTGVLAVVKGYGLTLNDVGAALATFGDNNIRGSVAATDLRMAVQSLAVPAKDGIATLQKWGLTGDALSKDMQQHGLVWTLNALNGLFKKNGVTASTEGAVITDMFGKKAGSGLAVLMGQLDRVNSKVPDLAKGASGFASAWQTAQHTLSQQLADIKAGFDSVMIRIGQFLIPQVSNFISLLENRGAPVVHSFATALSGIASGFTGSAATPAPVTTGRNARLQEGAGAAAAPAQLSGWQKIGQTLKGIAGDFESFAKDVGSAFRNLATAAQPVLQVLGGALLGALVGVGKILANVVGPALKGFTDFLAHHQGLVKFFAEVIIGGLITKMAVLSTIKAATGITDLATKIVGFPTKAISGVGTAIEGLKTSFKGLKKAGSWIGDFGGKIKDAFGKIPWKSIGSGISDGLSGAWDGIVKGAKGAADGITGLFQKIPWSDMAQGAKDFGGKIADLTLKGGKAAWQGVVSGITAAKDAMTALKDSEKLAAAWAKIQAGAQAALDLVMDANPVVLVVLAILALVAIFIVCYEKVGWFRDAVNAAFKGIAAVAMWLWHNVFEPAFQGIAKLATWLWTNVIKPAASGIAKAFTNLASGAQAAFKWIISAGEGAASWLAALPGKILGWFGDAASWLLDAGKNIIIGLWNGIVSMGSWIASSITGFIKSVIPGPVLKVLGIFSPSRVFHEIGVNVTRGLVNGITSGGQQVTNASTGLARSAIRGFGTPGVGLGISGGRQLAMAGVGFAGGAAAAQAGSVVNINVAGTVVAERQLRDLVEKLNLQHGARNSQTYQSYRK